MDYDELIWEAENTYFTDWLTSLNEICLSDPPEQVA